MPDLEISGLPQLAGSDLQGTDPIAIADISASETKKLTVADLSTYGVTFIPDGTISGDKITSLIGTKLVANSVTADQIAANAIGSSELANLAVDTAAIQDGAITDIKLAGGIDGTKILALSVGDAKIVDVDGAKILTGTVTADQLGTDAVTATELADNAVDTAAVVDGAITNVKIGINIDGAKILAASITSTQLAANSVTASELASLSVDTAAIQTAAVTDLKIATGISGTKLTDGTVSDAKITGLDGAKLTADSVDTAQLAANSVTSVELAANSVGLSELSDASVDTAAVIDSAITDAKLASGISGSKLTDATVSDAKIISLDGGKLTANSVDTAQLAADSVTSTELTANSVGSSELIDLSVSTATVQDAAITDIKLASGIDGAKLTNGSISDVKIADISGAKIADDSITAVKLVSGISGAKLTDASIGDAKIIGLDGAKLTANSVGTTQLAADSVTATELAASSVGSSELADLSVDTAAIQDSAVTNAKLAPGINGSKLIDATIGDAKITDLDGAKLNAGSVTATQIAANAIGSSELADNSVDTAAVIDSAITDVKLASGLDGGKLTAGTVASSQLGTDSVLTDKIQDGAVTDAKINNFINGAKLSASTVPNTALGTVTDRGLNQSTGSIGIANVVTASTQAGITWDGTGLITAATGSIPSADLPVATATTPGAISVPAAGGLAVDGAGAASIANSITAATKRGIEYDEHGSIISVTDVVPVAGIPLATSSTVGGVKAPGPDITVDVSGALALGNSGVTAGTYPKVVVNAKGVVTTGSALQASDIPDLDAGKITSGTFGSGFLAANSVTAAQLADYGIAKISSSQPTPEFAGQLWVNPTDRTAYVWVGQVDPPEGYYLPLNNEFGAAANLRFGGTYDANANTIASLNNYGSEAGLTVGSALVAPTSASSGVYLLVTTAGTGTNPAPAVALDVGDWILSPGSGTTWTHVNLVGAGISVIDAGSVTYDGTGLTPAFTGVADAGAAIDALWGRTQIATLAVKGIVLESTEVTVDNSTGAMAVGVVDEGSY